jgi:hypothetical protein
VNALEDRELVDVLADRPDLLAVADAVALTQRRRRAPRRGAAIAVIAAAAAGVLLAAPWGDRGPGVLDGALAAIGTGPVIHAVVEYSGDDAIVDLGTGKSTRRVHRMEFWYDESRLAFRSRLSTDGVQTTDGVTTPDLACSDAGCVDNDGLTAQLDPSLAGFTTGYRDALASGDAVVTGQSRVGDRAARLLTFTGSSGETTTVTVDAETHRPLQFFSRYPGGRRSPLFTVIAAESIARDDSLFVPPKLSAPRPTAGSVSAGEAITLVEAARALGRAPLWLGERSDVAGKLRKIELQRARTEFTDGREVDGVVVRLRYGRLQVGLASEPEGAYALGMEDGGDPAPPAGAIALTRDWGGPRRWSGELRVDGFWVTLVAETREALLRAARSLHPARRD